MLDRSPVLARTLRAAGLALLPASHRVPVTLLLRPFADDGALGPVLRLTARGTTLRLEQYAASALTVALLRAECDCEAHRLAGAAHRTVLAPDATPERRVEIDGAARFGWSGLEAALLSPDEVAPLLAELLAELAQVRAAQERAALAG